MMEADSGNLEKYMEDFVDLQLEMHSKKAARLNKLKDKIVRTDQRTERVGCDDAV